MAAGVSPANIYFCFSRRTNKIYELSYQFEFLEWESSYLERLSLHRFKSPRVPLYHDPAILVVQETQSLINVIKDNSKQQPVKRLLIFFMAFDIE